MGLERVVHFHKIDRPVDVCQLSLLLVARAPQQDRGDDVLPVADAAGLDKAHELQACVEVSVLPVALADVGVVFPPESPVLPALPVK